MTGTCRDITQCQLQHWGTLRGALCVPGVSHCEAAVAFACGLCLTADQTQSQLIRSCTSLASQGYWTGGFEDNSVAVALHQRAAEQGNVEALLSVGDSFWFGRGAPRDWRRAAEVYTAASKLQSSQVLPPDPMNSLRNMQLCTVSLDLPLSRCEHSGRESYLPRLCAPQALFNLGFMHEYGAGLPQVKNFREGRV